MISADREDAEDHPLVVQARDRRSDLLDRRRGRHRDRHHVVDHQRRRRDKRHRPPEVPLGHRVAAAAGRIGEADLAVADGDRDQQDGDRDADPQSPRQGGDPAEDQDAKDLLGRVGRRADGVRAEDRERLLLRQPLAELLLARQRPAEQDGLAPWRRACRSGVVGADAASLAVSWPGPVQRKRAEWGRSTRTRRSPGLRPWSGRRPPIIGSQAGSEAFGETARQARRRASRSGPTRRRRRPAARSPRRRRCRSPASRRSGRRHAAGRRCPG